MARPAPPGKRKRISLLDAVVVIGGVLGIIAFNRMSIGRLESSLPEANMKIVGEWMSTSGPEHLVFRADKTVSMIVPATPAQGNATPAAPETNGPAPVSPESASSPAPVTGKYQTAQKGKVIVKLMNGKSYSTTISQGNTNRFDLIDSTTGGVTTFDRAPAVPGAVATPNEPSQ